MNKKKRINELEQKIETLEKRRPTKDPMIIFDSSGIHVKIDDTTTNAMPASILCIVRI